MVRQAALQFPNHADWQPICSPETSHQSDALRAIKALGASAAYEVPAGALLHIGSWLNWPHWLVDGTDLPRNCALPQRITAAEDIIIIANVLDNVDQAYLVNHAIERSRPLLNSLTSNAFMCAPTFGEMMELLKNTVNIQNPHFRLKIVVSDDYHIISVESEFLEGEIHKFLSFYCLIFIYRTISGTMSDISKGFSLETTYFADEAMGRDAHWLGDCRLQFGGQANHIRYPAGWAASPNIEFDPALWLLTQEECRMAEMSRHSAEIIDRIRNMVANVLDAQGRVPRLKQVGTELKLSSRTIMRALANNGTSFYEIVEDYRRWRAAQMINDRTKDLAEIATTLGFTDQSSFGRSFRKWFGTSPGRMRSSKMQYNDDRHDRL